MSFLFTTFVLTKENYEEWSNKKKEELMSKGLWEIVENGYEWPKDLENMTQMEKKTFASLRWKDHCARIIMNNGVDEVASDHILGEDSSNNAWNLLQKEYGKKTDKIEKLNCIGEKKGKDVEESSKLEALKEKVKEEEELVEDERGEDEKDNGGEEDENEEEHESKRVENEEEMNEGDEIEELALDFKYEKQIEEVKVEKIEEIKIEDVKIKPGEMNCEVDVKIDEEKRPIEEKKVILEGRITEIVKEISVATVVEFHDNKEKEVSKDYMIYILNNFIFETMVFENSCKNEFWKTFKDYTNELAKVYKSETKWMIGCLIYGQYYFENCGRDEKCKITTHQFALRISTSGKKINKIKKELVIPLFLPKHVRYKESESCVILQNQDYGRMLEINLDFILRALIKCGLQLSMLLLSGIKFGNKRIIMIKESIWNFLI